MLCRIVIDVLRPAFMSRLWHDISLDNKKESPISRTSKFGLLSVKYRSQNACLSCDRIAALIRHHRHRHQTRLPRQARQYRIHHRRRRDKFRHRHHHRR